MKKFFSAVLVLVVLAAIAEAAASLNFTLNLTDLEMKALKHQLGAPEKQVDKAMVKEFLKERMTEAVSHAVTNYRLAISRGVSKADMDAFLSNQQSELTTITGE